MDAEIPAADTARQHWLSVLSAKYTEIVTQEKLAVREYVAQVIPQVPSALLYPALRVALVGRLLPASALPLPFLGTLWWSS